MRTFTTVLLLFASFYLGILYDSKITLNNSIQGQTSYLRSYDDVGASNGVGAMAYGEDAGANSPLSASLAQQQDADDV
eukprot:11583742-Ditylum_brightwellii.AAC.1